MKQPTKFKMKAFLRRKLADVVEIGPDETEKQEPMGFRFVFQDQRIAVVWAFWEAGDEDLIVLQKCPLRVLVKEAREA